MWFLMARKLVNLSISEISSVDRGAAGDRAGRGRARVMLTKRDDDDDLVQVAGLSMPSSIAKALNSLALKAEQEKEAPMNTVPISRVQEILGTAHICKRASEAVAKGEMDQFAFAELQKTLAMKMFPQSLTEGEALSRFFNTEAGREMLNAGCRANYIEVQKKVAGETNTVLKAGESSVPDVSGARTEGIGSGSRSVSGEAAYKIKQLMNQGLTLDEALDRVLKAKPVAHKEKSKPVADDEDIDDTAAVDKLIAKGMGRPEAETVIHRRERLQKLGW
jgi:uncharacterized protein YoaH (UPF0181 family)